MGACRVWFLLAWKERLLDIVVKVEKRRKVLHLYHHSLMMPACSYPGLQAFQNMAHLAGAGQPMRGVF